MTAAGRPPALARSAGYGRATAPVRHVHLGLGNFFRAHQAWYSEHAPDAAEWGIAAFTGRSRSLAGALAAQDGLYTLTTRSAAGDRVEIVSSLSAAHPGDDQTGWLRYLADPAVRVLTLTVTEAGYRRSAVGGLDHDDPAVQRDLQALRADRSAAVSTAPARVIAGLAARRRAGAGPLTVVPCDNLPGNGTMAARALTEFAALLDPSLASWIAASVGFVSTVVDRITPRATDQLGSVVRDGTGVLDRVPVVTEPFAEWILSGPFVAGRPAWDGAGALVSDRIEPFEHRKLWLLNGAHSLLAYGGSARGHRTVADAIGDGTCRGWVEQWWDEASAHLDQPAADVERYRSALALRFENARIEHQLAQIAADGSQKLPVRVLPVVRAERAAGRMPTGAARILAAWVRHLRGAGAPIEDPRAAELAGPAARPMPEAVRTVLCCLDAGIGGDDELVAAVTSLADELGRS